MSLRNWLRITLATISVVVLPCILSAQNSGVAGDGTFRLMWRGTDSHISLWTLDSSNNINETSFHEYGPYDGWLPIALTTANSGSSYILWRNTNGSISLWLVDPNLNLVSYRVYGPYDGWTAESLSVDTASTNRFRVLWRETDGRVSIWIVDPLLNLVSSRVYGPYFGFDPTPGAAARKSDQFGGQQADNMGVAAAMKAAGGSGAGTPMPQQ
jgi:hypothetical protein